MIAIVLLWCSSLLAGQSVYLTTTYSLQNRTINTRFVSLRSSPSRLTRLRLKNTAGKEYLLAEGLSLSAYELLEKDYQIPFPINETESQSWQVIADQDYLQSQPLLFKSMERANEFPEGWRYDQGTLRVKRGSYLLTKNLKIEGVELVAFDSGVVLEMYPNVHVAIFAPVKAKDLTLQAAKDQTWGSFSIFNYRAKSELSRIKVKGGRGGYFAGVYHECSLCIYGGIAEIEESVFEGARGEDSLNIKDAKVSIEHTHFFQTLSDAFDCDFCKLISTKNSFKLIAGDALDVSTSNVRSLQDIFEDVADKGISFGEGSIGEVRSATFKRCAFGVAVKDRSDVTLYDGFFEANALDVDIFRKKLFWGVGGVLRLSPQLKQLNIRKDGHSDVKPIAL